MEKENQNKELQIQKLVVELGKRIASLKDVVLVTINVDINDGSNVEYNSGKDPDFKEKYINFSEEGL